MTSLFDSRSDENDKGFVRVYPGKLQLQIEDAFVNVPVDNDTTVSDLVRDALNRFGLQDNKIEDYRCVSLGQSNEWVKLNGFFGVFFSFLQVFGSVIRSWCY